MSTEEGTLPTGGIGAKRCSNCRAIKPPQDFNRCATTRDGRQSYCRPCARDLLRERRRQTAVKKRERSAAKNNDAFAVLRANTDAALEP